MATSESASQPTPETPNPRYSEPLDKTLLQLDEEALEWFKVATGIENESELKEHICTVQAKAFTVFPYRCIRNFNFTKLKISRLPCYPQLLELGKTRPDAILLDLGCCFGNDARKAIHDGYPAQNVVCSDLRQEFWELGHELFRDKQTFAVPFVAGDVFDSSVLSDSPGPPTHPPSLKSVKTLTELQSFVSAIHTSSFFHLFNYEQQRKLAVLIGTLLSKKPGSIAFGSHAGALVPSVRDYGGPGETARWADNPESWTELWYNVLGQGKCTVVAQIVEGQTTNPRPNERSTGRLLLWSVTTL